MPTRVVRNFCCSLLLGALALPAAAIEAPLRDGGSAAARAKIEQIAEISGTGPVMLELREVQSEIKRLPAGSSQRDALINRLIYLRGKLVQYLETTSLEVNSVKAAVELAIAKVDDSRAKIVERRARVLKRNSIVNFISGGVTKMVGYSIALADINMPTNLLEIVDGGIQSSLSGLAVKEQEEEKHFSQNVPSLLLTVINGNNDETQDYPHGVWKYLDSRALGGEAIVSESADKEAGKETETRREKLMAAWTASGMITRHQAPKQKGVSPAARVCVVKSVSAQLLEDRAAMLSDLKSVVSQMNNSLMQLSQLIKASYREDPTI